MSKKITRGAYEISIHFLAVTFLVCGLIFAQQTSTNATTGKKFVGKIVSVDHDSKTITVAPGDMKTGSSSSYSATTTNTGQGTKTFKYNDHTKYHRDGGNEKDFSINNLNKGDNVLIQYDDSDNAVLISKLPPSEKAK